jgi:UDP-perosamine 4-acetyltransferase
MYIIGISTLSEIILDISHSLGIAIHGCFDDFSDEKSFYGIPILGKVTCIFEDIKRYQDAEVFVAIGDNYSRKNLSILLEHAGIKLPSIIHPQAYIEHSARIGFGNLLLGGVYVGSKTIIGNGNLIFPGVCFSHHNHVGNYNFFSPNVSVGGYTHIQSTCKIGMNSVVKPYIELADECVCDPLTVVTGEPVHRNQYGNQ